MQFNLYFTSGCHLCDLAEAVVAEYNSNNYELRLEVKKIDIALDEKLVEKFGVHIPVLEHESTNQTLFWPFELVTLKQFVSKV